MLKIAALIAFLFCQLVVEACPAVTRAKGGSDTERESGAGIEAAVEPSRAITPAADAVARRSVTVVCGSMTSIQRFERRIRHDQVRFRSGKEVS